MGLTRNPYSPFQPSLDSFYGREDLLLLFGQRLVQIESHRNAPRHMLLVGEGGIGKTAALMAMRAEALKKCPGALLMWVDLGDYAWDLSGLVESLLSSLPSSILKAAPGERRSLDLEEGVRSLQLGFPPSIQFSPFAFVGTSAAEHGVVPRLRLWSQGLIRYCTDKSRMVVVFVDQLGALLQSGGGTLVMQVLAQLIAGSSDIGLGNLLVVMAVRPEHRGLLEHRFREDIFDQRWIERVPVHGLDSDSAKRVIREPARRAGVHLDDSTVELVFSRCGAHPYYLQLHCSNLWDHIMSTNDPIRFPLHLDPDEVEKVLDEGQAKVFRRFLPKERRVLQMLALNHPVPQTLIQLRQRAVAGETGQGDWVDAALAGLLEHPHRPIKYHEPNGTYAIAHDLFAEYVGQSECGQDQRQLAEIQAFLDIAPRALRTAGEPLPQGVVQSAWRMRGQLSFSTDCIRELVLYEVRGRGAADEWAAWFLQRPDAGARLAAARAVAGPATEQVRALLITLGSDSSAEIRAASTAALLRVAGTMTPDEESDYDPSKY